MKKVDYQMIGYILTALGICLLIGAVFAFTYSSTNPHIYDTYPYPERHEDFLYPYRDSFWALLIVGIVLLVVGLGVIWRVKQETETGKP